MVKNENFICIQGWMVNELGLKGNDLMVYAIIYGFSQSESCAYVGGLQYLADWCNSTKQGVLKNLNNLIDKGYVERDEWYENNIKHVEYWSVELDKVLNKVEWGIKQSLMGYSTKFNGGIKQSLTNNIDNKKEENNNDKDRVENFVQSYNNICTNLPSVRSITDKRRKAIKKIIDKYSQDEISDVLNKANTSDFLIGKNDRGWKADIDFITREDKFISILEGKYGGKVIEDRTKFGETSEVVSKSLTTEERNHVYAGNVY